MKTKRKRAATKILVLAVALMVLALAPFRNAGTQSPQGGQRGNCTCDNLAACGSGKQPQPPKKNPPPGDPKKGRTDFTSMAGIPREHPKIGDKDLDGFDDLSGTAPATEANSAAGRTGDGTFAQQRTNIYNKVQYARERNQAGQLSNDDLQKQIGEARKDLEKISQAERAEHHDELMKQLEGSREDISNRVDPENTKKTTDVMKKIANADFNQPIDDLIDVVEQALNDNLRQGHAQSTYAGDTGAGLERAVEMVRALFQKVAKECDKKKMGVANVRRVVRLAQKLGAASEDEILNVLERCSSRTIIARATLGGITYEAKRCLDAQTAPNRSALAGDWLILITGDMEGSGHAEVGPEGVGSWNGNASMQGAALISQTGPVEISSGPGPCQMKLTASMAMGTVAGYAVSMPGVSGDLPIKLLDDVCTVK